MVDMPHNLLVNTRCTDSSLLIAVIVHGDQTGEQYSSNGRTYLTKALVKILTSTKTLLEYCLESSTREDMTMKNTLLN